MKNAVFGIAIAMALVVGALVGMASVETVYANPSQGVASSDLITLQLPPVENRQQLVLIDPRQRAMGVYQVDTNTGEIALKSVRALHWDLQLSEFISAAPLPREIRSLIDQR